MPLNNHLHSYHLRHAAIASVIVAICVFVVLLLAPFIVQAQAASDGSPTGFVSEDGTPCAVVGNGICFDAEGNEIGPVGNMQGFARDGIFGCNAGAYALSVGTLSAIGGVYVPVNDAAVTQNTGYLIYKECTLDGLNRKIAENGTAALTTALLNFFNTGFGGDSAYVADLAGHYAIGDRRIAADFLNEGTTGGICSPFKQSVKRAVAVDFLLRSGQPEQQFSCPAGVTADELTRCKQSGEWCGWNTYFTLATDPRTNPYWDYELLARPQLNARLAAERELEAQRLNAGNLFQDIARFDQVPTANGGTRLVRTTLTPGFLLSRIAEQITGSGFRQLENADEIDQVVSTLFSGLITQIAASPSGLQGLSFSQGGVPPYLDRLAADTSAGVRQSATNAALQILASALTVERGYRDAKKAIRDAFESTAERLRSAERQCWGLIEDAVDSLAQKGTCTMQTDVDGNETEVCAGPPIPYTTATSTQQSTQIIALRITARVNPASSEFEQASEAVRQLEDLVRSVTNTSSPTAQSAALNRLDALVANRIIHNVYELNAARQERDGIEEEMDILVEDTLIEWGSGSNWCNVNNPSVVEGWLNVWRN